MPDTEPKPSQKFKSYEVGSIHVDVKYLPQMPDENENTFLAIDLTLGYPLLGKSLFYEDHKFVQSFLP